MSDPVSWIMLATSAMSAAGSIAQGNAQAAQLDAQAQAANYNAMIQREQAAEVGRQSSSREDLQRKQVRQIMGRQIAAGAESGVNITTGSASDVFRQSLYDAELDAMNIRYEGELNRVGFLNQSRLSDWEGQTALSQKKAVKQSSYLNAAVSLIGGAYGAYGAGAAASGGAGASLSSGAAGAGLKAGGGVGLKMGGGLGLR